MRDGRFVEDTDGPTIDLSGMLAIPGLINAHDHLEFALYPLLGAEGSYRNARQWAEAVYKPDESPIREHLRVPKRDRLVWGGLRNLLAGVTTVCHHNPYDEKVFDDGFPVRVVRRMGWAHSLGFGGDVTTRFAETPPEWPFLLHAAEGVDDEARAEIGRLDRLGVLSERTVLIHCTDCGDEEWAVLERCGCGVVWCPLSNAFLFGGGLSGARFADCPNAALGTDSPLTAGGGMFEALAYAVGRGVSPGRVYSMVTEAPARLLRLPPGAGTLAANASADWVALRDYGYEPGEAICCEPDLELVCVAGVVMLVSEALARAYPQLAEGMRALQYREQGFWVRADVAGLIERAQAELRCDLRLAGCAVTTC